ncbi:hypothetical protein [Novosphingobium sp. THN1]|uniref:hypothetical protein n=1 Tax=Novosphingobium sp. THN1 TaxID=1016987 RepID=UPI0013C36838|nr:hypothetical protein [Novosphingobium sp. THN1]
MTRPRAEIYASRARRLASQARRYAILAAYERGEKAEAIAAEHNVTVRLVCLYAAQAGISRPQGRPRKAA